MKNFERSESKTERSERAEAVNMGLFEIREGKYREISGDVWKLFKKYLPSDASLDDFGDDVGNLDKKYKGKEGYRFMQRLLKVYFDELNDIKG